VYWSTDLVISSSIHHIYPPNYTFHPIHPSIHPAAGVGLRVVWRESGKSQSGYFEAELPADVLGAPDLDCYSGVVTVQGTTGVQGSGNQTD
jgi:hypothetical protein